MSLADLPEINLIDVDADQITNNIITTYEALQGVKLFPGDPVRVFLLSLASIIVQQRVLINDAARQNLLRYAAGNVLDAIGDFFETARLPASGALVTLRFTLSAPQTSAVTIPAGTRATPGGNVYFATNEVLTISPGETSGTIAATCTMPGTAGNGYLIGQINNLVDPVAFVAAVTNTTASNGGSDEEDDDAYRIRINESPEKFSVAGPTGAYEYWAKTANPGIIDVSVISPAPVEVNIYVLMEGGELPAQEVLDQVTEVLTDDTVRPLTDMVTVLAPTETKYDIEYTYFIDRTNASQATAIQQAVATANDAYVLWQKSKIGRDINPSKLFGMLMDAGVRRVVINSPVYTVIDKTAVAMAQNVNVTFGGLEDD